MAAIDSIKILWDYLVYENALVKADAIIGFGSNDITIATRASQLFIDGWAPYLLFSGGLGKGTEGVWSKTEAETFFEMAVDFGIDKEKIFIENKSTNTGENILFSKELFANYEIKVQKIIVVHQPNMGRRIYATIRKQWPEIIPIIAPANCSLEEYMDSLISTGVDEHDLFSNIVGDFQRIDVFAKYGYQIPQEIPDEAQKAFEELCALGYTKYIV